MKYINHKLTSISLILILILGTLPIILDMTSDHPTVTAATIIVDQNGGGNYTAIQAAVNAANPGDTIYVWAGNYNEMITIDKTLTLIGNGTENTTIDGFGYAYHTVSINANWTNITGFKFTNSTYGYASLDIYNRNNCSIYNNNFTNNYYGINAWYSDHNTIKNNTFYNNSESGCSLSQSTSNYILNNTFVLENKIGLYIYFSDHNTIDNNSFLNNYVALQIYYGDHNTVNNSLLVDNYYAIYLQGSSSSDINNNSFTNDWVGIYIQRTTNTNLKNNTMISTGVMIQSQFTSTWTSCIIDTSNTVNGKPVYMYINQDHITISNSDAGQILINNCHHIIIENLTIENTSIGLSSYSPW